MVWHFDENLENFKISEKKKKTEGNEKKKGMEPCSTSYQSGNQDDGLTLVAILNLGEIAGACNRGNL